MHVNVTFSFSQKMIVASGLICLLPRQPTLSLCRQPRQLHLSVSEQREGAHLSLKGLDDEVQRVGLDAFDALLHHVVAVLVLYALQHVAVQLAHHLTLKERQRTGGKKMKEGVSLRLSHWMWPEAFSKALLWFTDQ